MLMSFRTQATHVQQDWPQLDVGRSVFRSFDKDSGAIISELEIPLPAMAHGLNSSRALPVLSGI
jgi:hypothetical protein